MTSASHPVPASARGPVRGLRALRQAEALELASTMSIGRLVHSRTGRLSVSPVNFLLVGADVLVRTGEGELLTAAREQLAAAFEVDDLTTWSRSGWSLLVRGRLTEVTDPETVRRAWAAPAPWTGGDRDHVVLLAGEEVTGRIIDPGPGGTTVVQR